MKFYKIELEEENGGQILYVSCHKEVTKEMVREYLDSRVDFNYEDFTVRRITQIHVFDFDMLG